MSVKVRGVMEAMEDWERAGSANKRKKERRKKESEGQKV
jgi:hypothetical protein